ncbi:extracellular protease [Xanthomonas oryzae pv. oryzicola]|nr:extracellular protease [Xanthomonas oryzae pv. oryzicola]
MAAWHWAGLAISWEVLQLKVRANQETQRPAESPVFAHCSISQRLHR